ncbi:MAG: hypothetical protein IKL22_04815 [Lachnospiraceae bacterium]|nr:hypothetical protein [Lachnospiraceae bacterium]
MLGIILGLLKVIGIILLVLLITLILLVSIVLLVPIRYSAKGHLCDEEKAVTAKVTWLCKIIRVKLDYNHPAKPILELKVFWIDVMKMLNKKKESGKPKKVKVPKELKEIKKQKPVKEKGKKEKVKKEKYHPAVNIALLEAADAEAARAEALKNGEAPKSDASVPEKITDEEGSDKKLTFEEKIEKILFKITTLYDKITNVMDKAEYYIGIYEEEETQGLIKDSWKSVCKILKSIRPKVFQLQAVLGFDSPDTTGKVYGYYCMAMPWLGEDITLEPVFDEKYMDVSLFLKGRIQLITIVINGLKIVLDKRLKRLIHKFKNGGNKNG